MRIASSLAVTSLITVTNVARAQSSFADLARPFAYDPAAPLDLRLGDSTVLGTAIIHVVTYASPKGGRVPAYLVVPARAIPPYAGIVFVHWGQGNRSEFLAEATALAPRGIESLLIDAPYNRLDDPNRNTPDPLGERNGYIQLVIDIRRGVDLLTQRSDIDSTRLAYVGHSLGATWGGVVVGLDHRIKAAVLMGGLPTLTEFDFPDPLIQKQATSRPPDSLASYRRALEPINPVRFVGQSGPTHLFFQWAMVDRYISRRMSDEYFTAAGQPKQQHWYYSSHEFNDPQATTDRDRFLIAQLHIGSDRGRAP
jgi:dienelactone hydrolase